MQKELKNKKHALFIMAILIGAAAGIFSYLCYKSIKIKNLKISANIMVNVDKKNTDHYVNQSDMNRKIIIQCLSMIIILSALLLGFFAILYNFNLFWLWFSAILFSLLLCMGIITIWYLEIKSSSKVDHNIVADYTDVEKFFSAHKKENPHIYSSDPEPLHFIPIGFIFYSIEINKELVSLYAYPWLKKNSIKDSDISGTFISMNAINQRKPWTVGTMHFNNIDDLSWQEQFTIHTNFDYTKYPFDQQNITIFFEHEQTSKKVILTPDFIAYKSANTPYPPLDTSFHLDGWAIKNAYFFYELSDYSTDFGWRNYWQVKNFPFLSYTIQMQRKFLEPLLAGLIPIIIILFITFACLILLAHTQRNSTSIRLILALLSSLFFANVLSYQNLQEEILTPDITYLKSFYIITYIIIFLVTANTMLYTYQYSKMLGYEKNLVARLLYWPIILTILFVTTLLFFY